MKFSLFIDIEPIGKQRPRVLRSGRSYTPKKTVEAEEAIQAAVLIEMMKLQMRHPIDGPLILQLTFGMKRPKNPKNKTYPIAKPDIDNMCKLVMDALNDILWYDDAQVVRLIAHKQYTLDTPYIQMYMETA